MGCLATIGPKTFGCFAPIAIRSNRLTAAETRGESGTTRADSQFARGVVDEISSCLLMQLACGPRPEWLRGWRNALPFVRRAFGSVDSLLESVAQSMEGGLMEEFACLVNHVIFA